MKHFLSLLTFQLSAILCLHAAAPISVHPKNPHYFLFRSSPTVIITSGEHYGAVLNLDFDYRKYLDTLSREGMNSTRTFAGSYCEPVGAFKIAGNTLAPLSGRFISPWARSTEPGHPNGGNKFDLTKWDDAYFDRLRDFLAYASKRGVIVELNLFCPFYEDGMWNLSPMNASNNVNGVGQVARTNVYTLDRNGGLLAFQESMVRKIVTELRRFDNLYYEICNEPYFGGVTLQWQHHIAEVIRDTEKPFRSRHLISQNVANGSLAVTNPHPAISIFNFHYASPPDAVARNYKLNKVIGDNETGFRGTNDAPYRMEAWDFMVAGGALFNHLDYSFVSGSEDGSFVYPASQPGGGNAVLRRQFRFLSEVMRQFDFVGMAPDNSVVKADLPSGTTVRALVKAGKDYLIYVRSDVGGGSKTTKGKNRFSEGDLNLSVTLPAGKFTVEWLNPTSCRSLGKEACRQSGASVSFRVPAFEHDIALTIRKR